MISLVESSVDFFIYFRYERKRFSLHSPLLREVVNVEVVVYVQPVE